MKKIINSVFLTGKAGTDPIIIEFTGGKKLARLSIAINETYNGENEEPVKKTDWFNLVFWNEKVALVESLKKGGEISIQGKLSYSEYTDKLNVKRSISEIIVFEVLHLNNPTED